MSFFFVSPTTTTVTCPEKGIRVDTDGPRALAATPGVALLMTHMHYAKHTRLALLPCVILPQYALSSYEDFYHGLEGPGRLTVPHRTHHSMEPAFRQERVALGWRRWVSVGGIIVLGNFGRGAPAHQH